LRTGDEEDSCGDYFIDANELVNECIHACRVWTGHAAPIASAQSLASVVPRVLLSQVPGESEGEGEGATDSPAPAGVAEASVPVQFRCQTGFVPVLCRRLRRLLDQPHSINLRVTATIALLLQHPHANLHQCLMGEAPESLPSVLSQVASDLAARADKVPSIEAALLVARGALNRCGKCSRPLITMNDAIHPTQMAMPPHFCFAVLGTILASIFVRTGQTHTNPRQPLRRTAFCLGRHSPCCPSSSPTLWGVACRGN